MLIDKRIVVAALTALERDMAEKFADALPMEKETALEFSRAICNARMTIQHGGFSDNLVLRSATVLLPGETT